MHKQLLALIYGLIFCTGLQATPTGKQAVLDNYSTIAHAIFEDSRTQAETLKQAIDALLQHPDEHHLDQAKLAWIQARVPYQQSEVFRFSHSVVDELEAQLNAWPLDEGLIDYVDEGYEAELGNMGAEANIIANPTLDFGGMIIDTRTLSPSVLADLNELGGSEANVASGYHAIEFLLWGQDLNGTQAGAGNRPASDYGQGQNCTNKHCERRRQYLLAATELLIQDLQYLEDEWAPKQANNYRAEFLRGDTNQGITKVLYSMGSLALGELAGERMKVALEANSTEDEHDCFSDNTHNSHYYNALGIYNVYKGSYLRSNGQLIQGPSLQSLIGAIDPLLEKQLSQSFQNTQSALQKIVDRAEGSGQFSQQEPMKFDQMIAEGNTEGAAIIATAIGSLVKETQVIEALARALEIKNLTPTQASGH